LPLAGRRILVTRGATQAAKLSEGLRALGAIPVEVPVLEIQPPVSYAPLDAALRDLALYDWLILTSANAARSISGRAAHLGIALGDCASLKVAAVGPATAKEVHAAGLAVTLMPESAVAESLAAALAEKTRGKRVLLARAAVARDVIPDALRATGAVVDVVDAYCNVLPAAAPELLGAALEQHIVAATFTSSSSVTHLAQAAQIAGIAFPFVGVPAISIGPITTDTLREVGWPPAAEADPHDVSGLIAAVVDALAR
jgi:uroporphyrinogen-III synthase